MLHAPRFVACVCLLAAATFGQVSRQHYIITTAVGSSDIGDGKQATSALLLYPWDAIADASGVVYVADTRANRIRRIALDGTISTIAGTGLPGFSGDGGRAIEAQLYSPTALAFDSNSNLYVADTGNQRIRVITGDGLITTVAGNGFSGSASDGQQATDAPLNLPEGVAVFGTTLFIADTYNNRIRAVDLNSGVIQTIAGTGAAGFNGDGTARTSSLYIPQHMSVATDGTLYFADAYNHRVRRLLPGYTTIETVAGNGTNNLVADGTPAKNAGLRFPAGVAVDSNAKLLYIADTSDMAVRVVDLTAGTISTFAGSYFQGYLGDGGPPKSARLDTPFSVALTPNGRILIADNGNSRIRFVQSGTISTLVGKGRYGGDGGPATAALLQSPAQLAFTPAGDLLIVDQNNVCVRKVSAATNIITTIAGMCLFFGPAKDNVSATQTTLGNPSGVAADSTGNIYIADAGKLRRVDPQGILTTIAPSADFSGENGIALDPTGKFLYVAETYKNKVVQVELATGIVSNFAGTGTAGSGGNGGSAISAQLNQPQSVAVAADGSVYIADVGNNLIRVVDPKGIIDKYAGNGAGTVDEGNRKSVGLPAPIALAFDADGSLLVSFQFYRVARIDKTTGYLSYIVDAPFLYTDYRGDGTLAASARIQTVGPLVADKKGNIFVSDLETFQVRKLQPIGPVALQQVAGDGQTGVTGQLLDIPLTVRVAGPDPFSLPDIVVQFSVLSGDATLDNATQISDRSGLASVVVTLGPTAADSTFQAVVPGLPPVTFTVTATSPPSGADKTARRAGK